MGLWSLVTTLWQLVYSSGATTVRGTDGSCSPVRQSTRSHHAGVRCVSWSPSEVYVASASEAGEFIVHRVQGSVAAVARVQHPPSAADPADGPPSIEAIFQRLEAGGYATAASLYFDFDALGAAKIASAPVKQAAELEAHTDIPLDHFVPLPLQLAHGCDVLPVLFH